MVDHISNRVSTRPTRASAGSPRAEPMDRAAYNPPPRPHPSFIPGPEALENLIRRALAALERGIYWDRGSIINILL